MLRKVVGAVAILAISLGVAMAEEIKGKITKLEGDKVSFAAFNKDTKKFDDAKDYTIAKDCKVSKMDKKNKVEVAEGLKAEALKTIDAKKGVGATINVDGGKVTEIILGGGKKKKDAN